MRLGLILLAMSMLPGCEYYARSPGQAVSAPDPTLYPAPAVEGGRYIPWLSGWHYTAPIGGR